MTQVTAGWARIHLRKNCAQLAQPASFAQSGQRLALHAAEHRALGERPVDDHRGAASAAARSSRRSASGSASE